MNSKQDLIDEVKAFTHEDVVFADEIDNGSKIVYGKRSSAKHAVDINGQRYPLVFNRKERRKMLAEQKRMLKKAMKGRK